MNIKPIWLAVVILVVVIFFTTGTVKYFNRVSEVEAAQDQARRAEIEMSNLQQNLASKDKVIENLQQKIDS